MNKKKEIVEQSCYNTRDSFMKPYFPLVPNSVFHRLQETGTVTNISGVQRKKALKDMMFECSSVYKGDEITNCYSFPNTKTNSRK